MDSQEAIAAIQLTAAVAVLGYASVLDLRTRRAPNALWIALSTLGVVLLPIRIVVDDEPIEYAIILIPVLAILADVFWDESGNSALSRFVPAAKYGVAIIATFLLAAAWINEAYFQPLLAVPIVMMVIVLMYMLDLIRGGADAKALISLAVLFPVYPLIASFPLVSADEAMQTVFPFAISVLTNAAILVAFLPLAFLVVNLLRRDLKSPQIFLGYRMGIDKVTGKHVWLMERIIEGKHVFYTRPKIEENLTEELTKLREQGVARVWITPKIPFIIPMLAGLLLTAIVGNLLFLLFGF